MNTTKVSKTEPQLWSTPLARPAEATVLSTGTVLLIHS